MKQTMSSNSIQHLSEEDIEQKAEEVLKWFSMSLDKPKFVPLNEFCLKLKNDHDTIIEFGKDLGYRRGQKVLGFFMPNPRSIYLDKSLLDDVRRPFILAHEIGHLFLHRKLILKRGEYEFEGDTEFDLATGKKQLMTSRDWIEWQANKFASCFLMPRATFIDALKQTQIELGLHRNLGFVYVNPDKDSKKDYEDLKERLALIYNVNKTNIEIRLKDLELVKDRRFSSTQHISHFFKVA